MKLPAAEEAVLKFLYACKDQKAPAAEEVAKATGLSLATTKRALIALKERGLVGGSPTLTERCAKALKEMDPAVNPTSEGYAEKILLLASALSKADETFLAEELGYDQEFVNLVGSRLRAAGIWKGNALSEHHWNAWLSEMGGTAFYCDVNVATGDFMIVGGTPDNPQYKMTESAKRRVERLRRDNS